MVALLHGDPIDGRAERLLDAALAEDRGAGYLHVVRTRPRERQLHERERVLECRLGSVVTTLPGLVRRLASRRAHPRASLSDLDRTLLVHELAATRSRAPLRGVAGLAPWLGALFSRLKQGDVFSEAHAFERFRSLDHGDAGTREALRLFGVYQARLVDLGLYDGDGLYLEVARDLGTPELPFDRIAPARRRLVVEGFYQTNVVERAIFERLFAAFDDAIWLVDVSEGREADAFGAGVFADQTFKDARIDGDLTWLRKLGAASATAPPAPDDALALCAAVVARTTLVTASNERVEARYLVERAAALVQDDPTADVVIAYPSDREAAPLLHELCGDVGLALEVAAWRTLLACAPARSLLNLLGLSAIGFRRERVIDLLRRVPEGLRLGDARLVASRVDQVARAAGVISGTDEWEGKLARREAALTRSLEGAVGSVGAGPRGFLERDLADARTVRSGMAALIALIPGPESSCTIGSFVATVRNLLGTFGFDAGIAVPAGPLAACDVDALSAEVRTRAAIEDVLAQYERSAALASSSERAWSEHVDALRAAMGATIVRVPPVIARGARLLGMRDLRGLVTDHLLVGGLGENTFPGPSEPAPLLDEHDAATAGARGAAARRREAEHLMMHALRSPRRSLVLARPLEREGADVLPALSLEIVAEQLGKTPLSADAALERAPCLGRVTAGRQLARALGDARTGADVVQDAAHRLAASGSDPLLAWRRLGAETARYDTNTLSRFEGMLETAAFPLLLDPGAAHLTMSSSRFEDYVKCPLHFFFKRQLKLLAPDAPDREVSPRERGSKLHQILFRFHAEAPPEEARDDQAPRLARIAAEELGALTIDGLFAELFRDAMLRGLDDAAPASHPGVLRAYLDYETGRDSAFRPMMFEAAFGDAERGNAGRNVIADAIPIFDVVAGDRRLGVQLTGAIDRIDVAIEGDQSLVLVLDYKTGDLEGKRRNILRGRLFQLPLYLSVLPRLIEGRVAGRPVVVGAAHYEVNGHGETRLVQPIIENATKKSRFPEIRSHGIPDGTLTALVAATTARARDIVHATLDGRFHPTGDVKSLHCDKCDYDTVCRGRGEAFRISRMNDERRDPQTVDLLASCDEDDAE